MGCGRRSGRCASDSPSPALSARLSPHALAAGLWQTSGAGHEPGHRRHVAPTVGTAVAGSRPRREAPRLCPQAAAGRGPPVWEARAPGRPLAQATLAARRWPLPARSRAPWPRRRPQPAMPRLQLAAALLLLCGSLTAPRAQEMQQPLLVDDECAAGDAAGDEVCGVKMLQTSASKQDGKGAAPNTIPDLAAEAGAAAARAAAEALLQRQSGDGAEAAAAMAQERTVDGGAQGSGSLDRATVRKTCGSTGSRC
ncbi:unnamed protein product [Prorocentrum cordatum]|uniref:Uncharacterized protein n=1 Tax=Prorocentrum cordatum TaxID=2364126 RepID=A0ABN9WIG4_9DINO|nr:unnamed protein product [Polarella glacialis]